MDIDSWANLATSLRFFKELGFEYAETRSLVPIPITSITAPEGTTINTDYESAALVGSSEQSFIHQSLTGQLPVGTYVSCGPCYRIESEFTKTHRLEFMKAEAFVTDIKERSLESMVENAMCNFVRLGARTAQFVPTDDGYDIEVNGIEVGSYGIRTYGTLTWIYGTVLAEPRFTVATENQFSEI